MIVVYAYILLHFSCFRILLGELICRNPDLGELRKKQQRKYLLIGGHDDPSKGLGNLLSAYPAAYYYAMFTGRDIAIQRNSMIGEMCSVVVCGFPFIDELALAYPDVFTSDIYQSEILSYRNFHSTIRDEIIGNKTVVRETGYTLKSDWWALEKVLADCVSRITGCFLGDVRIS